MATQPYSYKPLESATSIRLLKCTNGDPGPGLHFQIAAFDIDDASAPPYYCLSYTWGNPLDCEADPDAQDEWKDRHDISLCASGENRRCFSVTTNLYEFLCEFSKKAPSTDVVWIWIDAICINQADSAERNVQVSMMNRIYRSCNEVIIWVGRDGEDMKAISAMVDIVGRIPQTTYSGIANLWITGIAKLWITGIGNRSITDISSDTLEMISKKFIACGCPAMEDTSYDAVFAFFSRSWFHRIWTMQECILPSKGQVWGGTCRVSDMEAFARLGWIAYVFMAVKGLQGQDFCSSMIKGLTYFYEFLLQDISLSSSRFLSGGVDVPSSDCIHYSREKICSDPHDHIYATLGLQHERLAQVDYEIAVKELYSRVALHPSIRRSFFENAETVEYSLLRASRVASALPSWVPDFSSPLTPIPWSTLDTKGMFRAGGSCMDNLSIIRLSENIIRVAGFQEDEVALIDEGRDPIDGDRLLQCFRTLNKACKEPYCILNAENMLERFWRTLVIDHSFSSNPPSFSEFRATFRNYALDRISIHISVHNSKEEWEAVRSTLNSLLGQDKMAAAILPTWQQVENATERRRGDPRTSPLQSITAHILVETFLQRGFFITKKGRMGIASRLTEVGDKIMIVEEGQYPLVMRKGDTGHWKYIGQAYVENIMYGEALEGRSFDNIDIE